MPPPCFQRPCRSISWVGAPFWAMPPGHAHPPAVAAEELPIGKTRGFGNGLHPPGDLRFRQPEHLLMAANTHRPDGVQGPHGGGGDGHHGPAASTSVLERVTVMHPLPSSQRCTSSQVNAAASERRSPASDSTATRATSNFARSAACAGVSTPRPRRRGWTEVSRITASTSAVRGFRIHPSILRKRGRRTCTEYRDSQRRVGETGV